MLMNMKPFIFIALFFIFRLFSGCNDDNGKNNHSGIDGKLVNYSTCGGFKSARMLNNTPDSLSCVEYTFDATSEKLKLSHYNSGFNCCPESLYCTVSVNRDTIIIREYEKAVGCKCNCLYDLNIEITGVAPKKYYIRFVEPYAGNQPVIIFTADLAKDKEGSFCAVRKNYPWRE